MQPVEETNTSYHVRYEVQKSTPKVLQLQNLLLTIVIHAPQCYLDHVIWNIVSVFLHWSCLDRSCCLDNSHSSYPEVGITISSRVWTLQHWNQKHEAEMTARWV